MPQAVLQIDLNGLQSESASHNRGWQWGHDKRHYGKPQRFVLELIFGSISSFFMSKSTWGGNWHEVEKSEVPSRLRETRKPGDKVRGQITLENLEAQTERWKGEEKV